ncbi:PREDICTED: uncharacterized protein LOC108567057 isoform X2 [Nicrophorus vespilloides]|uniref:Uncharacterized protein LOC108567057 isoform X2 n=1 Tax=Nicrophorus vespilloides TaxID=110193 RepID=A0ABM1N7F2_NICVS|nr:PREDICTED: uncharacterized protein LOC108567057 isoform X2 [Nicrophorus vespilloides]
MIPKCNGCKGKEKHTRNKRKECIMEPEVIVKIEENRLANVQLEDGGSNMMEPEVLVKVEENCKTIGQVRVKSKKLFRGLDVLDDINHKRMRIKKNKVFTNEVKTEQRKQRSPNAKNFKDNVIRLTERHFPAPVPQTVAQGSRTQRKCLVCSHTVKRTQRRKDTKYMCVPCNVALCIYPCFEEFHTKINF